MKCWIVSDESYYDGDYGYPTMIIRAESRGKAVSAFMRSEWGISWSEMKGVRARRMPPLDTDRDDDAGEVLEIDVARGYDPTRGKIGRYFLQCRHCECNLYCHDGNAWKENRERWPDDMNEPAEQLPDAPAAWTGRSDFAGNCEFDPTTNPRPVCVDCANRLYRDGRLYPLPKDKRPYYGLYTIDGEPYTGSEDDASDD